MSTLLRLDALRQESGLLQKQYEQFLQFKQKDDVRSKLKDALDLFESSYSPRKKQIIQNIVPKLILDDQNNRLHIFINPFFEKVSPIRAEEFDDFALIFPKNKKSPNLDPSLELPDLPAEILSQSEKKVCIAEEWRDARALCELFFLRPKFHVVSPFYVNPLFKNKFFLQQKYIIEGLSARQIAQEIFSSKMAVLAALNRFSIPIREPHYNHGHPSQLRYGQKYKKPRLSPEKKEQNVIRLVNELHSKGFSLRHIARILNDIKIATKNRGKRWHQEMVRRILLNSNFTDN